MGQRQRHTVTLVLSLGVLLGCGHREAADTTVQAGAGAAAGGTGGAAAWPANVGRCQGKPGALRGKSLQTVRAARLDRSFIYYAPADLDPNTPAPVVFVPHGYTMNADMMFDITRYADIADREGLIVMFPNGQTGSALSGPWNVGNPDCSSTLGLLPIAYGNDQAFINEMLRFAEADQCLDAQHIYMTGFSMGGYLAHETGCVRPEIRAVAPHSGGTHDLSHCASEHKPVLIMHFREDALIPYKCATQARDRWVSRNGCQLDEPEVQEVSGGSCEYYKGCAQDGQVGFCTFATPAEANDTFRGHAWSGGSETGSGAPFAIPQTESASELSFRFFKEYAW